MRSTERGEGEVMGGGSGGMREGIKKKENEVVHYRLWSLLPLSAHYFCYLQRKDISLFLGGGESV